MTTMEERQTHRAIQHMAKTLEQIAKALDRIADHLDDDRPRARLSTTHTADK